jgi:hypothetical protein
VARLAQVTPGTKIHHYINRHGRPGTSSDPKERMPPDTGRLTGGRQASAATTNRESVTTSPPLSRMYSGMHQWFFTTYGGEPQPLSALYAAQIDLSSALDAD